MIFSFKKNASLVIRFTVFTLVAILAVFEMEFIFPRDVQAITLNELSSQIASLSSEEEAFVEKIVTTEANIENSKNQIEQLILQISGIEKELSGLESDRKSKQKSIDEKKLELEKRSRTICAGLPRSRAGSTGSSGGFWIMPVPRRLPARRWRCSRSLRRRWSYSGPRVC